MLPNRYSNANSVIKKYRSISSINVRFVNSICIEFVRTRISITLMTRLMIIDWIRIMNVMVVEVDWILFRVRNRICRNRLWIQICRFRFNSIRMRLYDNNIISNNYWIIRNRNNL